MTTKKVKITEIVAHNATEFSQADKYGMDICAILDTTLGLGEKDRILDYITKTMHGGIYILERRGPKQPMGVTIGGTEITHAQSGILGGKRGKIGTYDRIPVTSGDPDQHKMFIYLDHF